MGCMNYLVGDLQGCCDALQKLLEKIGFSPSRDRLWLLGDLVNRGPRSLATLRFLRSLDGAATCLLGNHDLHLLAVAAGGRTTRDGDTLGDILDAPDRLALIDWLRHQRMACSEHGWLMVHAGVVPQWDAAQTVELAGEVEALLRSDELAPFLQIMYGDEPLRWDPSLVGAVRMRFIINVLTRVRLVTADGSLELTLKDGAHGAPAGYLPWFEAPGRRTQGVPIAFGHWSALGLVNRPDLLSLDTGCVWGGALTAVRIDDGAREVIQVDCERRRVMRT
jgi:bis(5'-nucleosyl)-tetraphosphatase (symmetrical)